VALDTHTQIRSLNSPKQIAVKTFALFFQPICCLFGAGFLHQHSGRIFQFSACFAIFVEDHALFKEGSPRFPFEVV
jgi:hypothetical protein